MAGNKPFWTLRLHDKRDVLIARQKARQIARLLHYPSLQEACIAAGTFAIAAQARSHYEICELCFQIDGHQLMVYARPLHPEDAARNDSRADAAHRTLGSGPSTAAVATRIEPSQDAAMMKLAKPLPEAALDFAVDELAFMIGRINEQAPADLFGELSKQNQEILVLLHLLNHPQDQLTVEPPSAA